VLGERAVRVFFATRDAQQRSSIAYTDLTFGVDPDEYTAGPVCEQPVMTPGPIGGFDEHGVFPSSVVATDEGYHLYYIGWNQGVERPLFYAAIGLATSADGVAFTRDSPAPLLSRSEHDPCLVTSPHVYRDGARWRMTYVSGVRWWRTEAGALQSAYHIKCAESVDGRAWQRNGTVAIDFAPGETNIARSAVQQLAHDRYRMWFSYVHADVGRYRMGYAESTDGTIWRRDDVQAGIGLDDTHATEMICYPSLFTIGDATYMLYNGDGNGRDGFGVARLTERSCSRATAAV
jgi:predicted GH43/DUF377 family glycosyl hydrolase